MEIEIATDRLFIVPYKHIHKDHLYEINDCGVGFRRPCPFTYKFPNFLSFAVFLRNKRTLVGVVAILREIEDLAIWWIAPSHRGNGYAFEATAAVIKKVQPIIGLNELCASIEMDNKSSIRVAHKLGMRRKPNQTDRIRIYGKKVK